MLPDDAVTPHEIPRDGVEIRQDASITVAEALTIAAAVPFSIGKSTLQRWAKHWAELGSASPVRSVLVATRTGSLYRLDRDAFEAWCIAEAESGRSRETPQDPPRPQEISGDPMRSREASRDPARSHETSGDRRHEAARDDEADERLKSLEDENLQLRIDIGIRKELIARAREELTALRNATDGLLRENGALEFRLRQLSAPRERPEIAEPQRHVTDDAIPSPPDESPRAEPDALY